MRNRHISAWICLGLAFGACNQAANISPDPDTGPDVPETSEVETSLMQEVIALKARERDPNKLDASIREILTRYGHPLPPLPALPEDVEAPGPIVGALGKTAATTSVYYTYRKGGIPPKNYSTVMTIDVPDGKSFEAWTTATRGSVVDASLIAFRRKPGSGSSEAPAYLTRILAQNDDRSSSNWHPYIKWTNNTGATREVNIVLYANSASVAGKLFMLMVFPDGSDSLWSAYAQGVPIYNYNVNPGRHGCNGPSASLIELERIQGRGFPASSVAFNKSTGRGGYLRVTKTTLYESLQLEDVLPSTDGSFLLAFRPAVLVHDPLSDDLGYRSTQKNLFSCPVPIF